MIAAGDAVAQMTDGRRVLSPGRQASEACVVELSGGAR